MGLVIEFQYFPPVNIFPALCSETDLYFEQYETYQKNSFRNRCHLAAAQGLVVLGIPLLEGRNQKRYSRDVRVDHRVGWQSKHWKTIVSCYNRSPWFEHYRDELDQLFHTPFRFLNDWNFACFKWCIEKLDINLSVTLTEDWIKYYDPDKMDDWRNRVLPNSVHSIFPKAMKYRQVFEDRCGFIPHLSILDLIFCEGRNAKLILRESGNV